MSGNERILDDQEHGDTLAQAQPYRPGIKAGVDALPGWFKGVMNFANAVRAQGDYRDALEEAQQVLEDNPNSYVVIDMVTSRAGTRDFNVQLYHGTSVGHPRSLDQLNDQAFLTHPDNTHFRTLVHNLPNADLAYPPGWANRVIHTDYIEPNLSSDNEAGTEQAALETDYVSAAEQYETAQSADDPALETGGFAFDPERSDQITGIFVSAKDRSEAEPVSAPVEQQELAVTVDEAAPQVAVMRA